MGEEKRESKQKSVEGCEAIKSSFFFFAFDNDNICKFVKAKIVFLLSGHMLSLLLLILCGFSAHTHSVNSMFAKEESEKE